MEFIDAKAGLIMPKFYTAHSRYPAFLDKTQHFIRLDIKAAYRRVLHNGIKETLTKTSAHSSGLLEANSLLDKCYTIALSAVRLNVNLYGTDGITFT